MCIGVVVRSKHLKGQLMLQMTEVLLQTKDEVLMFT
jgi:hypothetical protein